MRTLVAILVAVIIVWPFYYLFSRTRRGKSVRGCLIAMASFVSLVVVGVGIALEVTMERAAERNQFVAGKADGHIVRAVFSSGCCGPLAQMVVIAKPESLAVLEKAIRGARPDNDPGYLDGHTYYADFYLSSGECISLSLDFSGPPRAVMELSHVSTLGVMHTAYYLVELPRRLPKSLATAVRILECDHGWDAAKGRVF